MFGSFKIHHSPQTSIPYGTFSLILNPGIKPGTCVHDHANTDMFPGVTIDRGQDDDLHNTHCCLVAIARLQITSSTTANDLNANNPNEFISRHAMCGKFTFVDQRVIGVLGYQPVDLLNKSCYDFFHPDDIAHMKENFEQGKFISMVFRS